MTETICPEAEIALFSEDGHHWFDADAPDSKRPIQWEASEHVTKIVIGTLEKDGENPKFISAQIPDDLSRLYPNLTHLHLWQIENLTHLPPLPLKLECLDVRGCSQLTGVPDLPESLDNLDLGNCSALTDLQHAPKRLLRLYVNGCTGVPSDAFAAFLISLGRNSIELVEFDASDCPSITSIKRLPRSIVRLVLRNCEHLEDVKQLEEFTKLRHLNLDACRRLKSLDGIPDHLQYVRLTNCENLVRFMGQDIGPYERGTDDRPNSARTLYSRKKFGAELRASAHAKLLLLGDGRVGKTTLAKRLQWDCLTPEQQADPNNLHLKPIDGEKFTHKVRFSLWKTKFQLTEQVAGELNERARATKQERLPCDTKNQIDGSLRIWDFGGQEIYHQTHRIFASEGSVFLIVWNDLPFDKDRIGNEKPSNRLITDDEWDEWNRRRSLDYWLDYIRSIRPDASIALVCTSVPKASKQHPSWRTRVISGRSEDVDRMIADLQCFYIDSVEEDCSSNPEYLRLLTYIREQSGKEASRIGIWQPSYYSDVSDYVESLLRENEEARKQTNRREHLLVRYNEWADAISTRHRQSGLSQMELNQDDIATITGYLHDSGQLFQLSSGANSAVIIDQEWASEVIYSLLKPDHDEPTCLFNLVRKRGGYFTRKTLAMSEVWNRLPSDLERNQILALMDQCGIIAKITSDRDRNEDEIEYLVTEKWFLPTYAEVQAICEATFQMVADHGSVIESFKFEDDEISQTDFRALMIHLGGILGPRALWFRDGMHATDDRLKPNWCFQVRWKPIDEVGFFGHIDARLTAPSGAIAELAKQVEEYFKMESSPTAISNKSIQRDRSEVDCLAQCYFRAARDEDYDIAISSSGSDHAIVSKINDALEKAGLRTLWYRIPACRIGDNREVLTFMRELSRPKVVLLFLSDNYFRDDPETNWYCLWELADAILRIRDGKRSVSQTLVAYAEGGVLTSNNLDKIAVNALRKLSRHFEDLYYELDQADKDTFRYYFEWSDHFRNAVASNAMGEFFKRRGTLGAYSTYSVTKDGEFDFSLLVADAINALKGSS